MFLGTPKSWWVGMGICFIGGLSLAVSGVAGTPGTILGVILVFAAIIIFAAAPMRYGDRARGSREPQSPSPPIETQVQAPPAVPVRKRPRAAIEARDASEV